VSPRPAVARRRPELKDARPGAAGHFVRGQAALPCVQPLSRAWWFCALQSDRQDLSSADLVAMRQIDLNEGVGLAHENTLAVRRTQLTDADPSTLDRVRDLLCDPALSPTSPLVQLCASSIICDEHISALSLDLKETE
jgi:hypothetical protein